MYKPFHLIGLELNVSILSAALRGEPTGAPPVPRRCGRHRQARPAGGRNVGWRGRRRVWGKLMTAADSLRVGGLPIGLANRVLLRRDVPAGQPVTWEDVRIDTEDDAYRYRRAMEAAFPAE